MTFQIEIKMSSELANTYYVCKFDALSHLQFIYFFDDLQVMKSSERWCILKKYKKAESLVLKYNYILSFQ